MQVAGGGCLSHEAARVAFRGFADQGGVPYEACRRQKTSRPVEIIDEEKRRPLAPVRVARAAGCFPR